MGLSDLKYFSDKRKPGKTKAFFICIVIASFLWLVHALNTVYTYSIKVPVTFKNIPPNKKTLADIPSVLFVQVKASGLKLCLILLNRPFTPVEIDFNNLKSGSRNQNYILSAADINFKSAFKFEIQVKRISPDTLYFAERTGYQKVVPLKVTMAFKCKPGYGAKLPEIDPAVIMIWGDTSLIRKIDTIFTQPLNLTEVDADIDQAVSVIKPDAGINTSITEARVKIDVEKLVEQTLIVPVNAVMGQSNRQVNIYPSKVRIKFTCLQNAFIPKDTSLFRMVVNAEKINPATKKSPVFLSSVPANVTVMSIEPKEVEILIIKNQ